MFGSSLQKMTITAYSNADFTSPVGTPFTVWINPASYTYNYKIKYNNRQAQGSNGPSPDFNRIGADCVSFDLMFDTTGIIPSPVPGKSNAPTDGVAGLIEDFKALVLDMNGKIHSPNYVKLSWAQLQFQCRMESLSIVYTLFKPDGTPIRAKASVTFLGFTSNQELAKEANKNSPDLTHAVTVAAGDTLPALCHRIYGSSLYYLRVAEANGLTDFRQLVPGTQLLFPPLSGAGQ
ncbi:LysM peptidoglycan-binding domain-containing protein [Niveispirillum sp. SYP-B3756]|uniref:LysM peptidoglycan-binding domain-containing protein n=1 Tax=Niveispirillum sp. SYP-B3756 TaxID=2662178 RepID=UPI001291376C|nr:LysM peptidoglycan-binding domain-containing protein [Niveispirillum sp. SYP-B3756]MQP66372.1 LysM peptidoglycan-binding domain-containing protein [Niveispirillum sp. SYP-B3756]